MNDYENECILCIDGPILVRNVVNRNFIEDT